MCCSGSQFMVNNFPFFGVASLLYAALFTFCLYENYAGITLPFFAVGSIAYYLFCMKKLSVPMKKASYFYLGAGFLLSIATVFTDNSFFIFYNYAGMLLLLITCLIHNFYDDEHFKISHYMNTIFGTVFGAIGFLFYPFRSFGFFLNKRSKKDSKEKYVWLGLLISIPLLLVVTGLLMSADAIFSNIFENILVEIVLPENFIGITFKLCLGFFGSYCIVAKLASKEYSPDMTNKRTKEPIIAITFTTVLTLVYLLFCTIQIRYLFLGDTLPSGYTYSQYAREGFYQLLFVCVINLAIVLFCISRFGKHKVLNIILSVFCGCTFIMIASSAMRMILYIKVYYLSLDRVLVLWALTIITLLMVCIFINIYKENFPLFRYGVVIVTVGYIMLSVSRPDTYIASYNIEKNRMDGNLSYLDYNYLFSLSTDATPVLEQAGILKQADEDSYYDDEKQQLYFYYHKLRIKAVDMDIRSFNFSRRKAYEIMQKYYDSTAKANVEQTDTELTTTESSAGIEVHMDNIYLNELGGILDSARIYPDSDALVDTIWEDEDILSYYGTHLVPPYIPADLTASSENTTQNVILSKDAEVLEDTVWLEFYTSASPVQKRFYLKASKIGLIYDFLFKESGKNIKLSSIGDTEVAIGYDSVAYGPHESPEGYYDQYVAQFKLNEIEYELVFSQIELEEVLKVVASIIYNDADVRIVGEEIISSCSFPQLLLLTLPKL